MELEKLVESYNGSEEDYQSLILELKKVLKVFISDSDCLQHIALNSYIHQLGFEKYIIYNSVTGKNIRLHYWSDNTVFKDDIHSHCASFKSVILNGSIKQNTFELTNEKNQKKYLYFFDSISNSNKAKLIGLTGSKIKEAYTFNKKQFYNQEYHSLHQVVKTTENTLTISIWDKKENPALVLKELSSEAHDCTCTASLSEQFITERFKFFGELLT